MIIAGIIIILVILAAIVVWRHQLLLKDRALLMRDAIRHRDFSFRLPTKGLLFGERALQEALNNMGHEIEKLETHNEVEAWQRLTRVLTHEIMNVITPIMSISQAYLSMSQIKGSAYEEGIRAIYESSKGLAEFVSNYRKLTQLEQPVPTNLNLRIFLNSVASLYPEIRWNIDVPENIQMSADESLLRQVFINLAKNAKEADAKTIGISYLIPPDIFQRITDKTVLSGGTSGIFGRLLVSNDGHVIPDELARDIFIPFFTTKPHGSGIGLALSRQILMMHGLLLRLSEHPVKGYNVTFTLESDRL